MSSLSVANGLLRALPEADWSVLRPELRRDRIVPGQVIEPRDAPIDRVFFPESGVASVVALGVQGKKMETGPFGREGMSGLPIVHGVGQSPTETVVQIGGSALSVPAEVIAALMRESQTARSIFLRYSYAFGLQAVQTALAAGLTRIESRLARWLLMLHDRVDGDEIMATHEFMAMMLGVRRPGVTTSMHILEGDHLVKSARGRVRILDRPGLEKLCGSSYGLPEREYRRIIGGRLEADDGRPAR